MYRAISLLLGAGPLMVRGGTLAVCVVLAGCDEPGIRVYDAPKVVAAKPAKPVSPTAPDVPGRGDDANGANPANRSGSMTWTVPEGWTIAPANAQMGRVATFRVAVVPAATPSTPSSASHDASVIEAAVSSFPGDVGGDTANINRWRGQMGQPPLDDAGVRASLDTRTERGVRVSVTQIQGADGKVLLGAIITAGDGKTWFVKAMGPGAEIAMVRERFESFARSFRRDAVAESPRPGSDAVEARLRAWVAPTHWTQDSTPTQFVHLAWNAANSKGTVRVTTSNLRGDGGGFLANVNRWRGQIGLTPLETPEQQPHADLAHGARMVELTSPDGTQTMLAATVPADGKVWFFKALGPSEAVGAERTSFEKFIRSVALNE